MLQGLYIGNKSWTRLYFASEEVKVLYLTILK